MKVTRKIKFVSIKYIFIKVGKGIQTLLRIYTPKVLVMPFSHQPTKDEHFIIFNKANSWLINIIIKEKKITGKNMATTSSVILYLYLFVL